MARMTTTIELPSNGKLYPNQITLQEMTVAEEKKLYGSSTDKAIDDILDKCIVEDVNVKSLIAPDVHYALVELRRLTYGDEYPVETECQHCGKKFKETINLADLDVNLLPDDFEEPWEIELPVSKDKIKFKIPRNGDLDRYNNLAKKKAQKFKQNEQEVQYIFTLMMGIVSVNDTEMLPDELYTYLNNLSARDGAYVKHVYNKVQVGLDTEITATCPHCGEESNFQLPMTVDFFMPTFDD